MIKLLRRLAGLKCPQCGLPQPTTILNTMVGSENYQATISCEKCSATLRIMRGDGIVHFLLAAILLSLPVPFITIGDVSLNPNNPDGLFSWPMSPAAKSIIFYTAYILVIVLPVSSRILKVEICR